MSLWQALLLGILQGLTEFFPVSSSAHLRLLKELLHIEETPSLANFDLATHFGTLVALILYLKKDVLFALSNKEKFKQITLAIFPLFPAYFLMKPLRDFASQEIFLGVWLLTTSVFLFLCTRKYPKKFRKNQSSLLIGTMQAAALIPGISRSAATIWGGRLAGLNAKEAVRFSFLLSIPTICGGMLLEGMKTYKTMGLSSFSTPCLVGGISSMITGFVVVRFALTTLEKGKFKPFAWYCLTLAIVVSVVNAL